MVVPVSSALKRALTRRAQRKSGKMIRVNMKRFINDMTTLTRRFHIRISRFSIFLNLLSSFFAKNEFYISARSAINGGNLCIAMGNAGAYGPA